jgi:hypothetical protein
MMIVRWHRVKLLVDSCLVGDGMQHTPRGLHALKVPCPAKARVPSALRLSPSEVQSQASTNLLRTA